MEISEVDIKNIVNSVLKNVNSTIENTNNNSNTVPPMKMKAITEPANEYKQQKESYQNISYGVFEKVEEAINEGNKAQKKLIEEYQIKDRERIIAAIRKVVLNNKEEISRKVHDETKLGNYEDKVLKHELIATKTPGTEDLTTVSFSGDEGLTIVEQGPYGLIGAVTPVTNPTETIINNSIGMIAAGNAVVFNVHPSSKESCAYVIRLLNKTIVEEGGPINLITMVKNPSLETMKKITESSKIKLLVGTGGVGLVSSLLKSGKKAIGAGAGNPPVIVDETADVKHAAKSIIEGASFDNNLLCIAEKEVFAIDTIVDELIFHLLDNGAYMLNRQQLKELMDFALEENTDKKQSGCSADSTREYHISKKWVGKNAKDFLDKLNVKTPNEVSLIICEVDFEHPFVQLEQMMPVLPIVRVNNLDEAIKLSVKAEHGNRHTAIMHSKNIDNLTKFARAIETTIFVKNGSSLSGVGYGGEGCTTMTIAGPTGEGVTSAKTFTRQRRCVLAEGGFRII